MPREECGNTRTIPPFQISPSEKFFPFPNVSWQPPLLLQGLLLSFLSTLLPLWGLVQSHRQPCSLPSRLKHPHSKYVSAIIYCLIPHSCQTCFVCPSGSSWTSCHRQALDSLPVSSARSGESLDLGGSFRLLSMAEGYKKPLLFQFWVFLYHSVGTTD